MNKLPEPITTQLSVLFATLHHATDDLKIAGAEANLSGDFTQVASLNELCRKLQALEADIKATVNNFGTDNNAQYIGKVSSHKKNRNRTRKPSSGLRVKVSEQIIAEPTIAQTFLKTLRVIGLDRVSRLNKFVSNAPLIAKTPVSSYQKQERCEGWYVTTHVNKHNATTILAEIGRQLNMPIKFESF